MKPKRKASFTYPAAGILTLLLLSAALQNHAIAQTCTPPPTGIIAWWPLDEPSGTGAADIAGGSPGIHVNGPTPAVGKVDGALHFTRPQYVGVADSDSWAFGRNDFTIEFWADFDRVGGGDIIHPEDIFIGNDEGPGHINKWFFALGGGVLNFHINGPGVGSSFLVRAPFVPTPGQWYHLAVTRSTNIYTVFVNGTPIGSEISTASIPNPNAPLTIGQAEGISGLSGFMDGALDEVTIYNRALSQNEIATIAYAGTYGKCKNLTIVTRSLPAVQLGEAMSYQLQHRFGLPPYSWSLRSGSLPLGIELDTDGTLSGASTQAGSYTFTVRITDASGDVADKIFTLDVLLIAPPPNIRAHKTGTLAVPGRILDYFITVENVGDTTATDIYLHEFLNPDQFSLISADPQPEVLIPNSADASVIVWTINSLAPGETRLLTYQAQLNPTVPLGTDILGPAYPVKDLTKFVRCISQALITAGVCTSCGVVCGAAAATCGPEPATCPALVWACEVCVVTCIRGWASINLAKCAENSPANGGAHTQTAQAPKDPNEKLVSSRRYIQPDELLVYPIHFENIGTVEARDVFVTDVLDSSLDVSILNILTPTGASFDPNTRAVVWKLLGRNLRPHETGNLLLSIRPIPGLPSGTAIRNKAKIQFEIFESLDTNEVVNIIDSTRPTCVMDSLPAVTFTSEFALTWSGHDEVGEIDVYTILVSVDGGSFTPFTERTQTTRSIFTGERGKRYAFLCIATDVAGNVEVQDPIAEATTVIQPDTTPPVITVSASPATLWPPNGRMTSVTISGRIVDGETGVNASNAAYTVTDDYGKVQPSGAVTVDASGNYSFKVSLQASRDGSDRDGRHYTITVKAQDNAGNAGFSFIVVTVPHDRS